MDDAQDQPEDNSRLSAADLAHLRQKRRRIRGVILDYALGIAILGFNPWEGFLSWTLLIATIAILKMLRDLANLWGFARGQDLLAIVGTFLGAISTIWLSLMVWGTIFVMSIYLPIPRGFALASGLFTLTWGLGQATNQYYASGWHLGQKRWWKK